jgi:polysaccharide biosynthesis/export protein
MVRKSEDKHAARKSAVGSLPLAGTPGGNLCNLRTILSALLLAGWASAQPARPTSTPVSQVPGSKYYVWGQVRAPGAYSFIASPDILELLSAAGGPAENANLKRVVLIRAVTQKRTRINLQAMLDKGEVMRLSPGDVVIVPSSPWSNARDWLYVLTTAMTLAGLVITILNWTGS